MNALIAWPVRRFVALLSIVTMVLVGTMVVTAPQASASECDNGTRQNLRHYNPDDGYSPAIQFQGVKFTSGGGCVWGTGYLFPGYDAYGAGWASAEQVYVNAGAKIVCKDPVLLAYGITQWQVQWDSTGWHSVGTYPFYSSYTCVYQLD